MTASGPLMITSRMRERLHDVGHDDETIRTLTPPDAWREILLGHLMRGGHYGYWWCAPGRRTSWWPVDDPLPVPTTKSNWYFGVHPVGEIPAANADGEPRPPERLRSRIDLIAAVNCLFAEFDAPDFGGDLDTTLAHVHALEPEPTVIIASGGGYHCYWLLEDTVLVTDENRERLIGLQSRWVDLMGGDSAAKDLARVLRIPGTENRKERYAPDFPTVRIVGTSLDAIYTLDDLESLVPEPPPQRTRGRRQPDPVDIDDRELLDIMFAATNGDKARRLWGGDISGYPSASEADCALCEALAFFTGGDVGRIDRLFRQSGLYREKWKRSDYRDATIAKALEGKTEFYTPRAPAAKASKRAVTPPPRMRDRYHLTDLGNSERLVHHHGDDLRYCDPWHSWLVWDGKHWKRDDTREIERRANDTVRSMYTAAANEEDPDRRKALAGWAAKCEAEYRRRAMVNGARAMAPVLPDVLDADRWLLNVNNGTLNLRDGSLQPHKREGLITKLVPVDYDPGAEAPLWEAFLDDIMDGRDKLVEFLRRAVGYSLTGDTTEQCLFILYGTGANGKSTFLETLTGLLDDYAQNTPTETLLSRRSGTIPNDIARLKGARLVTAIEAESGRRLAENLVKQMTGGDTLVARFMRAEWFEFVPEFKLFLATNHKPSIHGTDNAIWRRIRLVPFTVTIPTDEQDPKLADKLIAEREGILAWAVRGCLDWQRKGLEPPAPVTEATEAYRTEMDVLGSWLDECCVETETATARANDLYTSYRQWAEENGEKVITGTQFGRSLGERGFEKTRDRKGIQYLGIGLLKLLP